jgi:hypothetical protein
VEAAKNTKNAVVRDIFFTTARETGFKHIPKRD